MATPSNVSGGYGSVEPNEEMALKSVPMIQKDRSDGIEESYLNRRATAYLEVDKRRTKQSIFAESIADQVHDAKSKRAVLSVSNAVIFQALSFVLAATFSGFTPFFKRSLMNTNASGAKTADFILPTPYIGDYLLSITLGNIIALCVQGTSGLKACWEVKSIARFAPVLMFSSIAEVCQMFVLTYLDGTTWRIIKQIKLPLTAVGVYVLLGRRNTTLVQWILIASITSTVFGYCAHSSKTSVESFSFTGVSLALFSISCSVCAGILGDYTYKKVQHPLYVQIPQGRVTSFIWIFIVTLYVTHRNNQWDKFLFGGWTWRTCVLSAWLMLKDWTSSFILKHLDSIWKSMAGILSLCIAYILDVIINGKPIDPVSVSFIVGVIINILAFTFTKRDVANRQKTAS